MKLREVLDRYEPFGYSDYEIIKMYFIENDLLPSAIKMLTDLNTEQAYLQQEYIYKLKECYGYSSVLYCNKKIDLTLRQDLVHLYHEFLRTGQLSEYSLNKAKEVFKELNGDNLQCFPQLFLGYLQTKGIGTQFSSSDGFRDSLIENNGKRKALDKI